MLPWVGMIVSKKRFDAIAFAIDESEAIGLYRIHTMSLNSIDEVRIVIGGKSGQ